MTHLQAEEVIALVKVITIMSIITGMFIVAIFLNLPT